jgi:WD40 repeat protein/DNA-binding CsgD family transcriptional regulator
MNGDSDRKGEESLVEPLSEREIEILELIADNLSKREISERLSLAYSTVKWYTQQTYQKLSVHSRRQAVLRARELGLLEAPPAVKAVSATEPAAQITNPYKGLFAFQEDDADNFFGREALTERLVARLGEDGQAARLLAVVGPSGSGKSSLVKAGLIPALRQGALMDSEDWFILEMIPGNHPFEALEASLLRIAGDPSLNLLEQLKQDEHGILQAARHALPLDESELLLVIDQFEEIFTLVDDKAQARHFLESLCEAVTEAFSPLRVVITLRADFFDRLLQNPDLSRLVQDRTEVVIPLSVDEMERAIRVPAEQTGVSLESGLVAAIVADMVEQPGALPLLQYALTEIFEKRAGRQLTLEAYQSIEGVQGVLERRAEATFAGLSQAGKNAARQLFLRLVTLSEGVGTDGMPVPDTRRRVLRAELEAVMLSSETPLPDSGSREGESAAAITEALDAFGKARLLYFDRDASAHSPTIEIAHEALLSEWQRLRHWLDEGREDMRMQRGLARSTTEWILADRDASFLLRGTRLSLFEDWVQEAGMALTSEENRFLEASLAERQAQQTAEAARKKRAAALERKARIFLRTLVIVLLLATLGSLALASTARTEASRAGSRELAVLAINNLEIDPERSILLSLQALRKTDTREAVDALHRAVQSSRVRTTLTGFTSGACSVEFNPDGKTLATTSCEGEVTIWETGSWQKLFSQPGTSVRYSPDNARLAIGGEDGTTTIWDLASRNSLLTLKGHNQRIDQLNFSPDGKLLVSTSDDRSLVVWNTETGQKLFSSTLFSSKGVFEASFSPDGKLLISTDETESGDVFNLWRVDRKWALLNQLPGYIHPIFSADGRWLAAAGGGVLDDGIVLWDLSDANLESLDHSAFKPQLVSAAHANSILNFAFSSDSSLLASVGQDGTAKVWRLSGEGVAPLMTLSGHTGAVLSAAFSPDGARLATAGQDGTVRIWDITPSGASEWFAFAGHPDSRYRMALTQDGRYLAAGSDDGAANVWDLQTGKQLFAMSLHGGPLFSAGISPDGSLLATAGYDNVAKIWKLNLPAGKVVAKPLYILDGNATGPKVGGLFPGLTAVIFSPDGKQMTTGGVDGMARIWDVKTGLELFSVQVHPNHRGVTSLAFSPDGRLLATASDGPEPLAKIWDIATGAEITTFSGHIQTRRIWGLAFSPDGGRVATGSQGGGLKIWDAKTGQELLNLVGHTSTVVGVAFSPDGKYLASASGDGTARVWDAFSGETLQIYTSPTGALLNIAFTTDGKRLVASGAGVIYGYFFDRDELVHLAESRLTRWFTPAECRQFLHQEPCPAQ